MSSREAASRFSSPLLTPKKTSSTPTATESQWQTTPNSFAIFKSNDSQFMIQIRGIVKATQRAQNSLKSGISPQDVASFKQFITDAVETIERLCAEAQINPSHLPTRSRSAYYFLKHIDLDNLPLAEGHAIPKLGQTIRLKNIKTQQRTILEKISHLASSPAPNAALLQELAKTIERAVTAIERICEKQQVTPANLTSSSRQIYAWMKFLTDESHLQLHLQATHRARQIALEICSTHYQESGNVIVELTNLAGLYKSRRHLYAAIVIISEGFINASSEVLEALVTAALLGKSQHNTRLLKDFASSEEYSEVLLELDLIAEAIAENSKGKCYDLDELFDKVNRDYFASTLVKPRLTWSQINTYRKFGHYEPAKNRVVMSLTLDDARIPEFVIEFVLYHELLHKYHGATWVNGRRMVHTPSFRRDEQQFKLYKEASVWLKKLASGQSLKQMPSPRPILPAI